MNNGKWMCAVALVLAAACSKEQAKQTAHRAKERVQDVFDISAPMGKPDAADAAQQREKERFDARWRQLQSFRAQQLAAQQRAAEQEREALQIHFVSGQKETFKGLDVSAINAAPVNVPIS